MSGLHRIIVAVMGTTLLGVMIRSDEAPPGTSPG